ncbi:MAG: WYL domain-containing protein [Bacteroidales bacterium]
MKKDTKKNLYPSLDWHSKFLMKISHFLRSIRITFYLLFSWRKRSNVDISNYGNSAKIENPKHIYFADRSQIISTHSASHSEKKFKKKSKSSKKIKKATIEKQEKESPLSKNHELLKDRDYKNSSSPDDTSQLNGRHESKMKVEKNSASKVENISQVSSNQKTQKIVEKVDDARIESPYRKLPLSNSNKNYQTQGYVNKPPKAIINPETIFIRPEEEKRSQIKFIGFEPNDHFSQIEPLNYPYVIMPRPRSIIKFPRKNKVGNKGFSEEHFYKHVIQYLKPHFKVYSDRIVIITSKQNPYEPDIVLIDEDSGINLFIDVEIDEPYDGTTREPIHYSGYDTERNKFFMNRGWLTIRFAEEQVWKNPKGCCKFIFLVISSISGKYKISKDIISAEGIEFIPQWTVEQAREWADLNYREQYLRIEGFSIQGIHKEMERISESKIESEIENHVEESGISITQKQQNIKGAIIIQSINTGKYVSCKYGSDPVYTIIKPIVFNGDIITCDCYVKNVQRELDIKHLTDLVVRDQPFLVRLNGEIGVDEIKRVVRDAIRNRKLIRMKYTRTSWTQQKVDENTGEIILSQIDAEQSLRTISDINYSVDVLSQEHIAIYKLTEDGYITAFCHKRNELRTFRVDRINELEILNI